jgi:O-6-methylguanine DNA methyltransferase
MNREIKMEKDAILKLKILIFLKKIPKGKVISYKTLGNIFSLHPRKIAFFMKYNKYPEIFPCYKVVKENGNISGYNRGKKEKIHRLENE